MNGEMTATLIKDLRILLPEGFAPRAAHIARETARCLAAMPLRVSLHLESLTVPPVTVTHGETDSVIARRLARAIMQQILDQAQRRNGHAG